MVFASSCRLSMSVRLGFLATLVLIVAGCGSGPETFSSAQTAYDRGVEAYENERYARAIEFFRAALDFGRTSELADDAQLYLARSYAGDRQYLLAGTEFTRFIEFYRNDPRIEEAAFERIQAYAALSPRYELDQTDTRQAIAYIQLYLQQYPNSEHGEEAANLADQLREKLARKLYERGYLYERRELYEAAALTYRDVLAEYPTSAYVDDALAAAVRVQTLYAEGSVPAQQRARFQEALDTYDQLTTLFPDSPVLVEAQTYYDRAYRGRQAATRADGADVSAARQE